MKLSDDIIKQIQSADVSASNAEVARQLWVSDDSVAKYRKQLTEALAEKKSKEEAIKSELGNT